MEINPNTNREKPNIVNALFIEFLAIFESFKISYSKGQHILLVIVLPIVTCNGGKSKSGHKVNRMPERCYAGPQRIY